MTLSPIPNKNNAVALDMPPFYPLRQGNDSHPFRHTTGGMLST